jgi:hypothetical protein
VAASVKGDEAIVYYGVAHEHFWPEDLANGRLWPFDATDHVTAAFQLIEAAFRGHVELEVRQGLLAQRVKSYLINDAGERVVISRVGTFRLRRHKTPPALVRFDFGTGVA